MIKVGIIGFGYMGDFHMKKINALTDVSLVSVFDINREALQKASSLGIHIFDQVNIFLKQDLDLVIIATPNDSHAEYAIKALQTGKNVLCEKPVTMNSTELQQVIKVAETAGKMFVSHQNRRWDADYLAACKMIKSGKIGKAVTIESNVFGERGVCFGWRADPRYGGGMLYDWGPHLIDQMLCLFPKEKVTRVFSRMLSVLTPAVNDYFELELQFSCGTYTHLRVGTFALQPKPRWLILGDRGTIKLDQLGTTKGGAARIKSAVKGFDSVFTVQGLGPSRTMAPLHKDMLEMLEIPTIVDQSMEYWNNILSVLQGEASPCVTHRDMLRQMAIIDNAMISAKEHRVVHTDI